MMSTALVLRNSGSRKHTTKVVTVALPQKKKKQGKRTPRSSAHYTPGGREFSQAYANTLNDPFEFEGVPLGYDCFLPTSVTAAYLRETFTVNADGNFSIILFPDLVNFCQTNFNPISDPHTANIFVPCSNIAAFQQNYREVRIISGGVRCFALFPEVDAPGVLFAGTVPDQTIQDYKALSTASLVAFPGSKLGIGSRGASATMRPYDNASFEFFTNPTLGFAETSIPYMTSTYIAGHGFPEGTRIWFEAIMHVEGIAKTSRASLAEPADMGSGPTLASQYFPTPGALWDSVQRLLSPSVVMDAAAAAGAYMTGGRSAAAASVGHSLSRRLGMGSAFNRAVLQNGRRSTVMIEEMQQEAAPARAGRYVMVR